MKKKRIVLNTFASLGDLHPYVALALELRERGYHPIIAANNSHRPVAEAEGIEFHAVLNGKKVKVSNLAKILAGLRSQSD